MTLNFAGAKLHLGCGEKLLAGWINADGQPGDGIDLVLDIHKGELASIPGDSLLRIYTSHLIEHLYVDHLPPALAHMRRMLQPGGVLTIATTSLEAIYQNAYLKGYVPRQWNCYLFGNTHSIHHPMMAHRQTFTAPYLTELLMNAGFREVRPWTTEQYPEIHALNDCARTSWHVTLSLEAVK